jgi:hypothetical protein
MFSVLNIVISNTVVWVSILAVFYVYMMLLCREENFVSSVLLCNGVMVVSSVYPHS